MPVPVQTETHSRPGLLQMRRYRSVTCSGHDQSQQTKRSNPRHTVTENQQTKSKALASFEAVLMRGGGRRQRVQGKLANREVGMRSWAGMGWLR